MNNNSAAEDKRDLPAVFSHGLTRALSGNFTWEFCRKMFRKKRPVQHLGTFAFSHPSKIFGLLISSYKNNLSNVGMVVSVTEPYSGSCPAENALVMGALPGTSSTEELAVATTCMCAVDVGGSSYLDSSKSN